MGIEVGPNALSRGTTGDVVMCFVGVLRIDCEDSIQQCRAVLELVGQTARKCISCASIPSDEL